MKYIISCLLALLLVTNVTACGTKGRLKTPDQVERDEAKKARQAEKEAKRKAKMEEEKKAKEAAPQPTPSPTIDTSSEQQ